MVCFFPSKPVDGKAGLVTKDLTDKIDLLISLAHQQGETLRQQGETLRQQGDVLVHLDARVSRQEETLAAMNTRLMTQEEGMVQLSKRLDRHEHLLNELTLVQRDTATMIRGIDKRMDKLEDRMTAVTDSFAEVRVTVKGQVPAAEFYELRGRVEEISRRLPTPIAYTPPKTAAE